MFNKFKDFYHAYKEEKEEQRLVKDEENSYINIQQKLEIKKDLKNDFKDEFNNLKYVFLGGIFPLLVIAGFGFLFWPKIQSFASETMEKMINITKIDSSSDKKSGIFSFLDDDDCDKPFIGYTFSGNYNYNGTDVVETIYFHSDMTYLRKNNYDFIESGAFSIEEKQLLLTNLNGGVTTYTVLDSCDKIMRNENGIEIILNKEV